MNSRYIGRYLIVGLAVIGGVALAGMTLGGCGLLVTARWTEGIEEKTVLEIDFQKGLEEYVPGKALTKALHGKKPTVRSYIEGLIKARDDKRVVGIIARIGGGLRIARVQEIRDAIKAFRKKGKFAVAYAETFGEFAGGHSKYYLATAFDEIYLQPSGDIGFNGLMMATPFIKGTLDKLGVEAQMDHRKEYKNFKNFFTHTKFSKAHKEASLKIINSLFDQICQGIAQSRGLTVEKIKDVANNGPLLAQEALAENFVDGLAYRDEIREKLKKRFGEECNFLKFKKYFKKAKSPFRSGKRIALIYGVGGVKRGSSGYDPMTEESMMGSDTVCKAFRQAIKDDEVKAILFRVDSPGGSYVASDTIWRETIRAKEKGKPVIVSMGSLAASGGYFVSMEADKIVAQPGTLTGSIGVLAGKMYSKGLFDKLGISWDEVHTSRNAGLWQPFKSFSRSEWDKLQASLDRIYEDFTAKVAKGRKLPKEKVLEIAKGRVWTGLDAKERGLVDELGGFERALELAKEASKIGKDDKIELKLYPKPDSAFAEMMQSMLDEATNAPMEDLYAQLRPLVKVAHRLGLYRSKSDGVLRNPTLDESF